MVVTDSRKSAVRYRLAMDRYLRDQQGGLFLRSGPVAGDSGNHRRHRGAQQKGLERLAAERSRHDVVAIFAMMRLWEALRKGAA